MPRSAAAAAQPSASATDAGQDSGLFSIFTDTHAAPATSPNAPGDPAAAGLSKVQQALMRKVGPKMGLQLDLASGKWSHRARAELTEEEELELDRLREELIALKSDADVVRWGLEHVFGYPPPSATTRGMLFPDPEQFPVAAPGAAAGAKTLTATPATRGPLSRMYPDLLLLLFVVLRDTHQNPSTALSFFHLAKSNPYSYITGCTTALYLEVLRTHWNDGAGDVEGVLGALDEMRANGVPFDDKVRELVRAIGDAIRIDQERAELRLDRELAQRGASTSEGNNNALTPDERDRQVQLRRYFDATQVGAWSRMERIVEENQDELEDARRVREDERWHDAEAARRERLRGERAGAYRERPDLMPDPAARGGEDVGPHRSNLLTGADRFESPSPLGRPGATATAAHAGGARGSSRPAWETWKVPTAERDSDGNLVMPKRPSFVNPYKIRRRGLSKEEKAAKDTKHPALWWKR